MPLKKISQKNTKGNSNLGYLIIYLAELSIRTTYTIKCENIEQKEKLSTDYKEQKNQKTELIRTGKKDYYQKYFTANRKNLKKFGKA